MTRFLHVNAAATEAELAKALSVLEGLGWATQPIDAAQKTVLAGLNGPEIGRISTAADHPDGLAPDACAILIALGQMAVEQSLCNSVPSGHTVDKVVVGFNWTLVRAGALCGIARSPARGTEGARTIRPAAGFSGMDLRDLAANLVSTDPLERSVGLAAVNCFWNRPDVPDAAQPYLAERGGLASIEAPGEGAIIVGGFRGALKRLPQARIVEREPKPGDIPVGDAPAAYKNANTLAITAQTLMNGSLAPVLRASDMVPHRILVGPSCPACPILFDHGIDELFGAVIKDPDAAERFILETGTMIMLDHIATNRTLRAKT